MIGIIAAIKSIRGTAEYTLNGDTYAGLEWLDQSQTKPTEQEVNDEIDRLDAAAVTEVARIEDTKNDTEAMAFLDLMKSKTSLERKDWLSSNVADPNVRKVLQGLMSIVLWKVA